MTVTARFWAKVKKTETCWLWEASTTRAGYGQFRLGAAPAYAHRLAYEWLVGPIPEGMKLDHRCHVTACVNPAHLRVVSHKENLEHRRGAQANSKSGVRGVYWSKAARKWEVQVMHNRKQVYGGLFTDLAEAERAAIALRNSLFTCNDHDRVAS